MASQAQKKRHDLRLEQDFAEAEEAELKREKECCCLPETRERKKSRQTI